jgi:hypothetical protein
MVMSCSESSDSGLREERRGEEKRGEREVENESK